MPTPAELALSHTDLKPEELEHLQRLLGSWSVLSDLSFSDLLLLVPVHAAAFDEPWEAGDIVRFAEDRGGFALAVEDSGALAGFILCRLIAGEAEVLTLAVRPAARRRGIGRALVEAAITLAAHPRDRQS